MAIDLRWVASSSASCFHLAAEFCVGREPVDARVAQAVAEPIMALAREIDAGQIPTEPFWQHLLPLSAGIENNTQLAELVLRKTVGPGVRAETLAPAMAGRFSDLEVAYRRALPDLADQLALRAGPLRSDWEARGPGLLAAIARMTDERVAVERADVILVQPASGGGGAAHLPYNSVTIETVAANPNEQLPEPVRLGWMLSQLNLDLPMFSETIPRDRLPLVAGLAMAPFALTAAEQVGWVGAVDVALIETAIQWWRLPVASPTETATAVERWFSGYGASKPNLGVALTALDRLV
jgi:hypothetical protein